MNYRWDQFFIELSDSSYNEYTQIRLFYYKTYFLQSEVKKIFDLINFSNKKWDNWKYMIFIYIKRNHYFPKNDLHIFLHHYLFYTESSNIRVFPKTIWNCISLSSFISFYVLILATNCICLYTWQCGVLFIIISLF